MEATDFAISIENLSFGYSPNQSILNVPSFKLRQKESTFLYGPSGCGKTTLLNLCAGIMTPQTGDIYVAGKNLNQLSASSRDLHRGLNIGVIFQQFNLIEYLNVFDNVLLPARLHPKKNYQQTKERALELLNELELLTYKDQMVSELSIGQRQRVAAVRSFLLSPPVLIADEPTSSLDQKNTDRFMQALIKLAEENGTSILFVSHDDRLKSYFKHAQSLEELNVV